MNNSNEQEVHSELYIVQEIIKRYKNWLMNEKEELYAKQQKTNREDEESLFLKRQLEKIQQQTKDVIALQSIATFFPSKPDREQLCEIAKVQKLSEDLVKEINSLTAKLVAELKYHHKQFDMHDTPERLLNNYLTSRPSPILTSFNKLCDEANKTVLSAVYGQRAQTPTLKLDAYTVLLECAKEAMGEDSNISRFTRYSNPLNPLLVTPIARSTSVFGLPRLLRAGR